MWARRLIVGASLAVASVAMVPGIASADTATSCVPAGSVTEPSSCVTTPTVANDGNDGAVQTPVAPVTAAPTPTTTTTTSSLPFTGADVAELAVIGTGAVLAGGVLMRRRRRVAA
jgi:LPXTG-motif cell wall-anchored protein